MRNLLFSVFSRFSLLLPFLSPTPEEINPHSFRFSMQTWEEIPTTSALLAGSRGGIQGSLQGSPTPWVCVRDAPAEPAPSTAWLRDHRDASDFCSALPHPSHWLLMIGQFPSWLQKPGRCLHFFPTIALAGWRLLGFQVEPCKKLQSDLVPGTEPVLCCPSAAKAAPACHPRDLAVPCGTHLPPQAHTSAAATTHYPN